MMDKTRREEPLKAVIVDGNLGLEVGGIIVSNVRNAAIDMKALGPVTISAEFFQIDPIKQKSWDELTNEV